MTDLSERNRGRSDEPSLAELAGLREATYRLFGLLFQPPSDEQLAEVAVAADASRRRVDLARNFAFFRSWIDIVDSAGHLTEGDRERLQGEYVELFDLAVSHPPCPLHESAYLGGNGSLSGWIVSDVERSYAAGGLALSASAKGEHADHAGLELEFMALLCAREGRSWDSGQAEEADGLLGLERSFLERHPRRWLPRLTRRLRSVAPQQSLYRRVAEAAVPFVVHDANLVAALGATDPASARDNGHRKGEWWRS
jgi:TorA maturation chaperone TorD